MSAAQTGPRILVIEDNAGLVANLFAYFEARDYNLDAARDGKAGLRLATDGYYHALIVDWMLPRMDGLELVRQVRASGSPVPILMLTARDELADKLAGFKAGVDDYLTKPFALAELEARIDALIARNGGRQHVLQVADLRFDLQTQQVTRGGGEVVLHAGPRRLLEALMRSSPAVIGRSQLEHLLWGEDVPDKDMLRSHIYELRKAVDGPFEMKLIRTVHRLGYRIAGPDSPDLP